MLHPDRSYLKHLMVTLINRVISEVVTGAVLNKPSNNADVEIDMKGFLVEGNCSDADNIIFNAISNGGLLRKCIGY